MGSSASSKTKSKPFVGSAQDMMHIAAHVQNAMSSLPSMAAPAPSKPTPAKLVASTGPPNGVPVPPKKNPFKAKKK